MAFSITDWVTAAAASGSSIAPYEVYPSFSSVAVVSSVVSSSEVAGSALCGVVLGPIPLEAFCCVPCVAILIIILSIKIHYLIYILTIVISPHL
jgi:hypothetical protein